MTGYFLSTLKGRQRRGTLDIETVLRDYTLSPISATTTQTAIAIDLKTFESIKVCFSIGAYTSYSAGVNEWKIELQVSDQVNGTFTPVSGVITAKGEALETEILIGGDQALTANSSPNYLRVVATKTGSPGSLSYGAWIVPS